MTPKTALFAFACVATHVQAFQVDGVGVGAIPDGTLDNGSCNQTTFGRLLAVSFPVSGLSEPVNRVSLQLTFNHSFVGDLRVSLASPGDTRGMSVFDDTGDDGLGARSGDDSDAIGPYDFSDDATGDWWAAARSVDSSTPIPSGSYRPTFDGVTPSSFAVAFNGLSAAQANGSWTLRVLDDCGGSIGSLLAARLFINQPLPVTLQEFSVD